VLASNRRLGRVHRRPHPPVILYAAHQRRYLQQAVRLQGGAQTRWRRPSLAAGGQSWAFVGIFLLFSFSRCIWRYLRVHAQGAASGGSDYTTSRCLSEALEELPVPPASGNWWAGMPAPA